MMCALLRLDCNAYVTYSELDLVYCGEIFVGIAFTYFIFTVSVSSALKITSSQTVKYLTCFDAIVPC